MVITYYTELGSSSQIGLNIKNVENDQPNNYSKLQKKENKLWIHYLIANYFSIPLGVTMGYYSYKQLTTERWPQKTSEI